jgi:hypothetical protein
MHSLQYYQARLRRSQRLRYRIARVFVAPITLALFVAIAAVVFLMRH